MKVLNTILVLFLASTAESVVIKCIQSADGTGDGTDCAQINSADPTQCHQPKFVEYIGYGDTYQWGCGPCDPVDVAACVDCTGDAADACNKPTANVGDDFTCWSHKANANNTGYEVEETPLTCKRLNGTALKCNMPMYGATPTVTGYTPGGCGPCSGTEKADGKCMECEEDSCNKPADDFQCYAWSWATDKWAQGDLQTCYRQTAAVPILCNAPNYDKARQADYSNTSPCGACTDGGEKTAETCLECEEDQCNNSPVVAVSFILAVMSALVFML